MEPFKEFISKIILSPMPSVPSRLSLSSPLARASSSSTTLPSHRHMVSPKLSFIDITAKRFDYLVFYSQENQNVFTVTASRFIPDPAETTPTPSRVSIAEVMMTTLLPCSIMGHLLRSQWFSSSSVPYL